MRGEKDFWEWLKQKYPEFDKLSLDVFHMQIAWNARAGDSDAQSAIQQGAVADLPAADSGLAKVETALSVYKEYLLLYENTSFKPTFFGYCQQQLTALAGR